MFTFALMSMNLFGDINNQSTKHAPGNFDTVFASMFSMIRILTSDTWHHLLYEAHAHCLTQLID